MENVPPLNPTGRLGNVSLEGNPFLAESISGRNNRIVDAVRTTTKTIFYRGDPPAVHIIGTKFPHVLNITGNELQRMPLIPHKIQVLLAKQCCMRDIDLLKDHPGLKVVDVSENQIETLDLVFIPLLTAFFAASCSLREFSTNFQFQSLEILNLSANKLNEIDISPFPRLKVLNIAYNSFTRFELNSSNLQELSIQGNPLNEFTISTADSLANLNVSECLLENHDFVANIPNLKSFDGNGNQFCAYWESFVVSLSPTLETVNGRKITKGERAIHTDRARRMSKQEKAPPPHKLIAQIRTHFRKISKLEVNQSFDEDILRQWNLRVSEREIRHGLILQEIDKMKCHYFLEEGKLVIYGALKSNEPSEWNFRTLELNHCPIVQGSDVENKVIELSRQNPVSLTLSNNLLETCSDILFLRFFESVRILTVEDNGISKMALFRPLVSALMPYLTVVNGTLLTLEEYNAGRAYFGHLLYYTRGITVNTVSADGEEYTEETKFHSTCVATSLK